MNVVLIASLLELLEKTSRLVLDVFLVCTDRASQLKIKVTWISNVTGHGKGGKTEQREEDVEEN